MLNHSDGQGPGGLRQGTKLALIAAACLLAVAVYFFVTPTNFVGKDGSLFGCGSPMSPNSENLAKGQCGIVEGVAMHKAILFLAMALLTAGLGYLLFGADPSSRTPRSRDRYDDEDDRYRDADDRDDRADRQSPPRPRRPRLGDEDEPQREPAPAAKKVRTRLSEDDDDLPRRRLSDDEPRERRRSNRYDDDAFDRA